MDERSKVLRHLVIDALAGGTRGHVGSSMSLIEILRVLYDDILNYRPEEPQWLTRDRCILSKGHGCLALYALLVDKKFFPQEALTRFCHFNAMLGGHPEASKIPGVEASTGALGHGLSIGVGMALAARIQKRASQIFVVMGDGEINEGSVWEAAMAANKHILSNLCAIIDYNKIQCYGFTKEVLDMEPLREKWESFGFSVVEVDGHDVDALRNTLKTLPFREDQPNAIICHTIKGKGIGFAENNPNWHHKAHLNVEDIAAMRQAIGAA